MWKILLLVEYVFYITLEFDIDGFNDSFYNFKLNEIDFGDGHVGQLN